MGNKHQPDEPLGSCADFIPHLSYYHLPSLTTSLTSRITTANVKTNLALTLTKDVAIEMQGDTTNCIHRS